MSARRSPSQLLFRLLPLSKAAARQRQRLLLANSGHQQGLTLIECLVAIVVITITVVTITPGIFLATASRVQARRAEQANQIAQSEVDRIRGIVERGNYQLAQLPPQGVASNIATAPVATSVATGIILSPAACTTPRYPNTPVANATTLVPVDVDGDCQAEFAMQVFRTQGCRLTGADPTAPPPGFAFGVRVYAYNPSEGAAVPTLLAERATLGVTAGRKDQDGNTRKPFQVVYSKASITGSQKLLECIAAN